MRARGCELREGRRGLLQNSDDRPAPVCRNVQSSGPDGAPSSVSVPVPVLRPRTIEQQRVRRGGLAGLDRVTNSYVPRHIGAGARLHRARIEKADSRRWLRHIEPAANTANKKRIKAALKADAQAKNDAESQAVTFDKCAEEYIAAQANMGNQDRDGR
jgi:hypothetical protein